jgi:hypothetical protein
MIQGFKRYGIAQVVDVYEPTVNPFTMNLFPSSDSLKAVAEAKESAELLTVEADLQRQGLKTVWKKTVYSTFNKPDTVEIPLVFDPENFLYFRCKAIASFEKHGANQNGDAFEWEELKKSYRTFVGKGFYVEHDSDDPAKSKGIIISASLNEEGQWVECVCAVDKTEMYLSKTGAIRNLADDIRERVMNAVSMGCSTAEAVCSECHNVAHNESELCAHCNPESPMYMKGRRNARGNVVFEFNRDNMFNELSSVGNPAWKQADILKYMIGSAESNLKEGFMGNGNLMDKISAADLLALRVALSGDIKPEKAEKENKKETDVAEMVGKIIDQKFDSAVKDAIKDAAEKILGPMLKQIPNVVAPAVSQEITGMKPAVKQKLDEVKEQLGVAAPAAEAAPAPAAPAPVAQPAQPAVVSSSEDESSIEEPKASSAIALGDGYELRPIKVKEEDMLCLWDRDSDTGIYIKPLTEDMDEATKIAKYRELLRLTSPVVEGKEEIVPVEKEPVKKEDEDLKPSQINLEKGGSMKISYQAGNTFHDSYFIAEEGEERRKVRASRIVPVDVQQLELENPDTVITPEEAIEQMSKEASTLAEFDRFVIRHMRLARKASQEPAIVAMKEEGKREKPGKLDEVDMSLDSKDVSKDRPKLPTDGKSDVAKLYGRLPGKKVGEPEQSLDLKSSVNEIKLQAKVEELTSQLETLTKKAKEADIVEVLQKLSWLKPEQKKALISKLANASEADLALMGEVIDLTEEKRVEAASVPKTAEIVPQLFTKDAAVETPVERLQNFLMGGE